MEAIKVIPTHCSSELSEELVLPDTPLHLSGTLMYEDLPTTILITDELISVIVLYDFYYKMVFTYQSTIRNNKIELTNVELDDIRSIFLFSDSVGVSGCDGIEYGKEYNYTSVKAKCYGGLNSVKDITLQVKEIKEIPCSGSFDIKCKAGSIILNQEQSLGAINFIMNHLTIDTYSISTNFIGKSVSSIIQIKNEKMIEVNGSKNFFSVTIENITASNNNKYTTINHNGKNSNIDYLCFERECNYVCIIGSYEDFWFRNGFTCFEKENDFDSLFNSVYKEVYNKAENYKPIKNSIARSLYENKKETKKETKSTKGYYSEEAKQGENGYYTAYFLIDNTFTFIMHTDESDQNSIEQLKVVYNLDPVTKATDEYSWDKHKGGVDPKYIEGISDESCKSFKSIYNIANFYDTCNVDPDKLFANIKDDMYTISGSGLDTKLTITKTTDGTIKAIIPLIEYEDSAKLDEIINKITKFTKPIPDGKCLYYQTRDNTKDDYVSLYNNVLYSTTYRFKDNMTEIKFVFTPPINNYYYTDSDNKNYMAYVEGFNDKYLINSEGKFHHKFVDFEGNDFVECNENLKNNVLKEFQSKISQMKKDEGIIDENPETSSTTNEDKSTTTLNENDFTVSTSNDDKPTNGNTVSTSNEDEPTSNDTISTSNDFITVVDEENSGIRYILNILLFSLLLLIFI